MLADDNVVEVNFKLPSYGAPGRILVRVERPFLFKDEHDWDYDVLDWDRDSSVFWVEEGIGSDYFLADVCVFTDPGVYVVEGITGRYIRGDGPYAEDTEDWFYESIRKATKEEIEKELLS